MAGSTFVQIAPLAALLSFSSLSLIAQLPPPNDPLGQAGIVQEPLRECVLHDFGVAKGDPTQYMIQGELTWIAQGPAGDDDFYGATSTGGQFGKGTIYKIPYQTGTVKKDDSSVALYDFNGGAEGANPLGGVTLGPDNFLYGTTYGGGSHSSGIIFKISRAGGPPQVTTLASFGDIKTTVPLSNNPQPTAEDLKNVNGGWPSTPLVLGNDNYLYGVTGWANGATTGTIYRISGSGGIDYRYIFMPLGTKDYGSGPYTISKGSDGMLYGTTNGGGLGYGTVFQFNPALSGAAAIKTIYKFREHMPNATDDDGAAANPLIQASDGTLYGTTRLGGPYGRGVVFSLTLAGAYKVLYAFDGRESNPDAGLVLVHQRMPTVRPLPPTNCGTPAASTAPAPGPTDSDAADYLYGIATANGVAFGGDLGILFRLRTDGTDFATVLNFDSQSGAGPNTAPLLARDNRLYASTAGGGPGYGNAGVFYRLDTRYLITGIQELETLYGTTDLHTRLEFQGNWRTHLYNNPVMQVATDIAGYQPGQTACSEATALHGITIRMKNPDAKVVQFFYRERLKIVTAPNGATSLVHMDGLSNVNDLTTVNGVTKEDGPTWLPVYDLAKTYKTGDQVGFLQRSGVYMGFTSKTDNNTGNVPPDTSNEPTTAPDTKFWAVNGDCNGTIHQCYPLTTNEMFPNWIPDAEPPSDLYKKEDTQVDCDGIEIFDSPSFLNDPTEEQLFTGITLEITPPTANGQAKGSVLASATWRITKYGSQQLQYWVPALAGGANPATVNALRAVLVKDGFTPDF
jgi:uncharacterized repeat protein (TIGR03803 family)